MQEVEFGNLPRVPSFNKGGGCPSLLELLGCPQFTKGDPTSDVARIYKVYLNNLYYAQSYSPGKEDSNDTQFVKIGPSVLELRIKTWSPLAEFFYIQKFNFL